MDLAVYLRFVFQDAAGDLINDGYYDLAIGVPQEEIGTLGNAGGVHVIYDTSPNGLSDTITMSDQFWSQDSPEIAYRSEGDDLFGYAVSASG